MMTKRFKVLFSLLSFFLFIPFVNAAGSATNYFTGPGSVYVGNEFTFNLVVSENGTGGLLGFGGSISYDTTKVDLVRTKSVGPFNIDFNTSNNKLIGMGASPITGTRTVMEFVFRAKAIGNANVAFSGGKQSDTNAQPIYTSATSKNIAIVNPPSGNTNLSTLTTNRGSLAFNKDNLKYNLNVESDIVDISISGNPEDSGASVSGFGNHRLNFGNNAIKIIVTAPSGAKKTYTINVNRKDNRSGETLLSTMSVDKGKLNPGFDPKTESYNLEVPYEVSSLNVKATAKDSKAKVSITGQNNLIAEERTDVKVIVTAENGSSRTYTIHVKRGKDPNKLLSSDNYLESLTVSNGILSPAFDKEQLNYIVYLPFEIDTINVEAIASEKKYATIEKIAPNNLAVGNNTFTFNVKAEDGTIRKYNVIVFRGNNLRGDTSSENVFLKSISINNKKIKKFNKNNNVYYYKKSKKMDITAEVENPESTYNIEKIKDVYIINVVSKSGLENKYILIPKENNYKYIIICIGSSVIALGVGLVSGKIFLGKKKKKSK